MIYRTFILLASLVLALLLPLHVTALEEPPEISDLGPTDKQYMTVQLSSLDDLARSNIGRQLSGNKKRDLAILQLLLDRKVVQSHQKRELQAMGVVMGKHLAKELDLHWVIYEDRLGRSRALRYKKSSNYLFPMTMISRLREAGNNMPVADIYQKAVDRIKPQLPKLPFQ